MLDGLRSSVRYDQKYYDEIVASLLPLLEKLTSGKTAQLISPNYTDMSDPEVAAAVGNSVFADLVSVAGRIYEFAAATGGIADGAGDFDDDGEFCRV